MRPRRNRTGYLAAALAVLCALIGCDMPEFTQPNEIEDLRILGIRAEPAEASPGDEVTITGLASNSDSTPYEGVWAWLVLAGLDSDAISDAEDVDLSDFDPGQIGWQEPGGDPFVYTVPDAEEIERIFGSYDKRGMVVTIVGLIVGGSETIEDVLSGKGKQRIGYKTFIISERPENERNRNPVFAEILMDVPAPPEGFDVTDEEGRYNILPGTVLWMVAKFDDLTGDYVTYSWFAREDELSELVYDKVQTWNGPDKGNSYVYVVCRNNYSFEAPGGVSMRSTGLDFGVVGFHVLP